MSQENEVQVKVTAETSQLTPGMEKSAQDVEKSAERMKKSVENLKDSIGSNMGKMADVVKTSQQDIAGNMSLLSGSFGKVAAVVGSIIATIGGITKAAKDTADYTETAMALGRAMGTTATQAGIWIEVAHELGSSTAEVEAASGGLTKTLRKNEEGLNSLGLETRDAHHKLKDMDTLMKDAIKTVNEYKEGADRNMAAQEIFGKAISGTSKLLLANAEAFEQDEAYIRSLGGQVSGEALTAWKLYDDAMDKIDMGMVALRNTIGNVVMPVIAKLAEWFSMLMPAAITVVRGALGGLMTTFWALKNGVVVVWETINAMVVSVAEPIRALAAAIAKAVSGDFSGAAAEIKGIGGVISGTWSKAMGEMEKSSQETSDRIGDIFGEQKDAAPTESGGKDYIPKPAKEKKVKAPKKEKADASRLQAWEAELADRKSEYMEKHDMYEMSLADEKNYWEVLLTRTDLSEKERGQIMKKASELRLQILKKEATENKQMTLEKIEEWKRSANDSLDIAQEEADQKYSLGEINKEQLLEAELTFEAARYEINRAAIEQRMELLSKDPNMNPVEYQKLKDQLLEIERKHALQKRKIENSIQIEQNTPKMNVFKTMESSFSSAITGMLTRAQTFRQAISSIFSSIANSFVTEMVAKPVSEWAMGLLRQTALYQTFFGTKKAMEATDAAAQIATQKTLGLTGVMSNASLAATAAMASVAAIPLTGWAMAPGVGAETFATAMAFLPSAEGGWDIPAGATGLMKYHEKEMMLPAQHADTIRKLGENGGTGGGDTHLHVKAFDSKDVMRVLLKNQPAVSAAMRRAARNFAPTSINSSLGKVY